MEELDLTVLPEKGMFPCVQKISKWSGWATFALYVNACDWHLLMKKDIWFTFPLTTDRCLLLSACETSEGLLAGKKTDSVFK